MADFEIITANYNNEKYLLQFLQSLEDSSIKPRRIIIVDDCSTDESVEVIQDWIKKSSIDVLLIKNNKNLGFGNSLNKAIKELSAPYFARIDPDDYVHPRRFEIQFKTLLKLNLDIIGSNVQYFRENELLNISNVSLNPLKISQKIRQGKLDVIHGSIIGVSRVLKDFTYEQNYVPAEDYHLFANLISQGRKIGNVSDPLTFVRVHSNSVSNNLKFKAVSNRYLIRDKIFHTQTFFIRVYLEYFHLFFYRKYLFNSNLIWLLLSIMFNPASVIRRISNKKKKRP